MQRAAPEDWYRIERVGHDVTHIFEPFIREFYRCNMWHVRGRDRDLLVDSGMGVVSLRAWVPLVTEKRCLAVASHTHFDHIGAHHEFPDRLVHGAEAELLARPTRAATLVEPYVSDEIFTRLPPEPYRSAEYAVPAPPAIIRHHIDGGPVASGTNRTFENISPVDGSLVSLVTEAGADEVDAAVAAAGRALRGPWAGLSTADREKLLHAVADEIDRRFEDFVDAEVADTGMPESFARSIVIPRGAANFRFFADLVKNLPVIRHPEIDAITFTGESATGEAIMKATAVGLRDVSFELGGKNPGIVFADCNLEKAIEETTRSTFANSGQICLATERLYVQRPVFDAFVEGLAVSTLALKLGEPKDPATRMGPLISHGHRDKVMAIASASSSEPNARPGPESRVRRTSPTRRPAKLRGSGYENFARRRSPCPTMSPPPTRHPA